MTAAPLTGSDRLRLLVALSFVLTSALVGVAGTSAGADGGSGSAVTVSGKGQFSDLEVTVSQTTDLTNQVVKVSWTGGAPTDPTTGDFYRNYLQIMQCWGDDPNGPSREQCQWGGQIGDARGGNPSWVTSRQVNYGAARDDPAETIKPTAANPIAYVPFRSATGKTIPGGDVGSTEFFDANTTNEIPFARTGADGTGAEFFEIQTALDAPGLGCGTPLEGSADGRACWLVVVPRGDTDVNGVKTQNSDSMYSSPLDATPWASRIQIPLTFQPIGASCRLGAAERPILGQESVEEAVSRWQPSLCASTGSIFGYSQVSDDAARKQMTTAPQLSFVSDPVPSAQLPVDTKAVYAPIALNGLVITFNIDSSSSPRAPPEIRKDDGKRMPSMKLNPRLVAKLLTQSYRYSLAGSTAPQVINNPYDLTTDNEFLALNPEYKGRQFSGVATVLEPVGDADSIKVLWQWIKADAAARSFIAGKPDPSGMTVNPNYKGLDLSIDRFPRNDLYCQPLDNQPDRCELDAHPYTSDMHEATRATSRGDTLARIWNPNATPPNYTKAPLQSSGSKAVMAVTDAATAARYNLPTATLLNASGKYVPADAANLLATVKDMTTVDGTDVLGPNPDAKGAAAYPLATLTYAATVPALLDASSAKDYKAFVDYAVGDGQTPGLLAGQLPAGYAPLPTSLRTQARTVAGQIVSLQAAGVPKPKPTPTPTDTVTLPPTDTSTVPVTGTTGNDAVTGTSGSDPSAAPQGGATPSPNPSASPTPAAVIAPVAKTGAVPVGTGRLAVLAALVLGIVAAASGPVLLRLGRRSS